MGDGGLRKIAIRYSVRTLLVGICGAACLFAWGANYRHMEQKLAWYLEDRGGEAVFDHEIILWYHGEPEASAWRTWWRRNVAPYVPTVEDAVLNEATGDDLAMLGTGHGI